MSEKLAALLAAIDTNPDLLSRLRDALPESAPLTPDMFLAAARAAGFDLSRDDLPVAAARLEEAELEGVAGGINMHGLKPFEMPSTDVQTKAFGQLWHKLFG